MRVDTRRAVITAVSVFTALFVGSFFYATFQVTKSVVFSLENRTHATDFSSTGRILGASRTARGHPNSTSIQPSIRSADFAILYVVGTASGALATTAIGSIVLALRVRHRHKEHEGVMESRGKTVAINPLAPRKRPSPFQDPFSSAILDVRSRQHLQDSLLRAIIMNAPFVIVHLSANYIIQMVNKATTAVSGLTEELAIGHTACAVLDRLGVSEIPPLLDLRRIRNDDTLRNVEITIRHFITGDTRHLTCSVVTNRISSSEISGYTVFLQDITTRKQWESFVSHSDRLNLIAEFAASTAHEIRNPLTTVRGFLQLQKRRNPQTDAKDHFQIMIEEIDRVDELISEYLTLSKHSLGSEKQPTEISAIIWDLVPLISAEANMRGIVVSILDLPESLCIGNGRELKQVFLNLIKNAIDAMAPHGVLTIFGSLAGTMYTVAISDTGCGIEIEKQERIFEPFFTTKPTGSGLGLSVSKKIIEAHQGEIQLDSEIGEGTTFFVSLPVYSGVS